MLRYFICLIFKFLPPTRLFAIRSTLLKVGGIKISKNAKLCGHGFIYGRGELEIGENTWISPGVIFYTNVNSCIKIGKNCDIGPSVKFVCGSHEIGDWRRRAGKGISDNIVINDGCWIGANSLLLPGTEIGSGSVVAAGTVVNAKIERNVLVAGVPCKIKKRFSL